jgi:hypothetical protein
MIPPDAALDSESQLPLLQGEEAMQGHFASDSLLIVTRHNIV